MCKYNPVGRFSNVSDAAARRPIFSVGGEIIPLKKSLCILPEFIEWNYPFLDNQRTQQINQRGIKIHLQVKDKGEMSWKGQRRSSNRENQAP